MAAGNSGIDACASSPARVPGALTVGGDIGRQKVAPVQAPKVVKRASVKAHAPVEGLAAGWVIADTAFDSDPFRARLAERALDVHDARHDPLAGDVHAARAGTLALAIFLVAASTACAPGRNTYPGAEWRRTDPAAAGFDPAVLDRHFHALAARNTGDMKWKKFFYKQLCILRLNFLILPYSIVL